jgi:hypothetical protein
MCGPGGRREDGTDGKRRGEIIREEKEKREVSPLTQQPQFYDSVLQ